MIFYHKGHVMFRTAIESDIGRMKDQLRASDVDEVRASHGQTPEMALMFSYQASKLCISICHKGKPVAMFGVVPADLAGTQASIWLLATNGLYEMWFSFLRLSLHFIPWMNEAYPLLYNYVDERNTVSIRWLKWCGAKFSPPVVYGVERRPFRLFVFEKEKTSCVPQP